MATAKAKAKPKPATTTGESVPIGSVKLDPKNARRHPERNVQVTDSSLARFGPARSIVIDKKGVVRAGNRTLESAKAAGCTELLIVDPKPGQLVAVRRKDWTPDEATAYALADNRSSELAEWDDNLADSLRELEEAGFDLNEIGWDEDEVDALLGNATGEGAGEDPGPQIDRAAELQKKWRTKAGQLWVIPSKATPGGEHRLLCGDSTKAEDVARVMGGEKAAVVLTDPPYGIDWTRGENKARQSKPHEGIENDEDTSARDEALSLIGDVPAAVFGSFYAPFPERLVQVLVWHKPPDSGLVGSVTGFRRDAEAIFLIGPWPTRTVQWSSVLHSEEGQSGTVTQTGHPHTKPVALIVRLIEACPPGLIFDPFLGSGTTIVAAEQTGRLAFGIEVSPAYVAVCLERLTGLGLTPALDPTGTGN